MRMNLDDWTLFRTIEADPVGTFAADADWAAGATVPADIIPIPRDEESQTVDYGRLLIEVVLTTANAAAIVARGTMTFDLQAIEVVQRGNTRLISDPMRSRVMPTHAMDSAVVAGVPQRKVTFDVRGARQAAIRISNFANVPGTAAELHMLYRLE